MIRNYLKIASRVFVRQKLYSIISVTGLVTGVTASLLILLFVADELSYDRFHAGAENIHRISFHAKIGDQNINTTLTGMPVGEALQNEASGIESVLRMDKWMTCPVRYEDRTFTEMNLYLADSNFFSFFQYELLEGNPQEVLKGKNKIVISETAALRYFDYKDPGDPSPIGKTLNIGSTGDVWAVVTGISKDSPTNAHFHFDFLMSITTPGYSEEYWVNTEIYTYFKVFPGTSIDNIQAQLDAFIPKYCAAEISRHMNISLEQFLGKGGFIKYKTQPLVDIHLHSNLGDEFEPNSDIKYVYLFIAIALMILVLACINFMNLATARASLRAKEVGVRKTIGAGRFSLVKQFMLESFLHSAVAFAISFILAILMLKPFNSLADKSLTIDVLLQPQFILSFIALLLIVTFIAGSYPSFYLTAFKPVSVLKGKLTTGGRKPYVRNGLVIFQFFISISLIISSIMIYRQIQFLRQQSLGFDKENVVGLMHTMNLGKNAQAFKNDIQSHTEFAAASFSNRLPPDVDWYVSFVNEGSEQPHLLAQYNMDYDHQAVMRFEMKEGRFFSEDFPSDTLGVILNEAAAKQMGLDKDWEGKKVRFPGGYDGPPLHVIGIVKNFNYETLKSSVKPMALLLNTGVNWDIAVRLTPGNTLQKVELLKQIWKKYLPDAPFEYSFVDMNFNRKFKAEERVADVLLLFTAIAIFIACIGLFGLATFTSDQRTKEIGVRKVMGASVIQILVLLSKNFALLILIAFIIAAGVSWYAVTDWLNGFAYRIDFSIAIALLAGAAALLIALIVVSLQSVRAAVENPVKSLRSE
jgi:putative ABC transport system permease protein